MKLYRVISSGRMAGLGAAHVLTSGPEKAEEWYRLQYRRVVEDRDKVVAEEVPFESYDIQRDSLTLTEPEMQVLDQAVERLLHVKTAALNDRSRPRMWAEAAALRTLLAKVQAKLR